MPYIKPEDRAKLNFTMGEAADTLMQAIPDITKRKGSTNYMVTRIVARAMKPEAGWSYNSISEAIAVLDDAAAEMRRRLLDVREDRAKKENGDIPEYEDFYYED